MARAYESLVRIRFRHCDPAGIVFYPRYVEIINDLVEEWFERGLGLSFHALHVERGIGTPTASLQCEFRAPSRWQETLRQTLWLQRLGRTSLQAVARFEGPHGQLRLEAALTLVTVDMRSLRPTPVPEDLRASMQEFLLPGQD